MPAKSESQRRFMFGVMGEKFARAHHFDNPGTLPERVAVKKARPAKKKPAKKAGGRHPMQMPHGLSFRRHKGKC